MIQVVASPVSLWPLIHRLQHFFVAQGREAQMRLPAAIRTGQDISFAHWDQPMFDHLRPIMARYWQIGIADGSRKLSQTLVRQDRGKAFRRMVRKDFFGFMTDRMFSLSNPSVIDAIDQATMLFCHETNLTATRDLGKAITGLREALKTGVQAGEAHADINKKVYELFRDPARSQLVTVTEVARATNHGSMIAYEKSGECFGTMWSTTSAPCPRCEALDGEERGFGEPFVILSSGNPAYRVVMGAPLHPRCFCQNLPVIG